MLLYKKTPFSKSIQNAIVYRVADIFCLTIKAPVKPGGWRVNEAMACSRPVLVSDIVGCAPDLVQHNNVGEIFESGNLDDLKTKLREMCQTNLNSTGKNAKEVIAEWNFDRSLKQLNLNFSYDLTLYCRLDDPRNNSA